MQIIDFNLHLLKEELQPLNIQSLLPSPDNGCRSSKLCNGAKGLWQEIILPSYPFLNLYNLVKLNKLRQNKTNGKINMFGVNI